MFKYEIVDINHNNGTLTLLKMRLAPKFNTEIELTTNYYSYEGGNFLTMAYCISHEIQELKKYTPTTKNITRESPVTNYF